MSDKQVEFFPFNAINEFMIPEYRLSVLQTVLAGFDRLPSERRSAINSMVKRHVQVPGFRNSTQAPSSMKARSSVQIFERRPEYTAHILQGWSELHADLREKVYNFLIERGWEVLPANADRTKLPGFLTEWPEGEDYDVLGEAFKQANPDFPYEEYDLRLMIVWLANRLPFDMDGEEEADEEEEEAE